MMPEQPANPQRYDAFISYSRHDKAFAVALEKALAGYVPPADLRPGRRRLNIFRDEQEITGSEYHRAIGTALHNSDRLVVLCSPAARESAYVGEEIRVFAAATGADSVIPVLVRGIPNNEARPSQQADMAFPDALLEAFGAGVPLAADFRDFDPSRHTLTGGAFSGAWYKTLADLLGTSRGIVEQREQRRRARRRNIGIGITAASMAVLVAFTIWALIERSEAQRQRDVALARQLSVQSDRFASDGSVNFERAALLAAASLGRSHLFDNDLSARERLELLPASVRVLAHGSPVRAIVFSADGTRIATGTDEGTARIWDQASGSMLAQFTHGAPLRALALAADGRHLMTAAADGTIRAWRIDTGEHTIPVTIDTSGWDRYMVAFSGDGTRAVTARGADDIGAEVHIWNLPDGTSSHQMLVPRRVATVALNGDGNWLAAGMWTGAVELWRGGKEAGTRQFAGIVEALAFAPAGTNVAAGSEQGVWVFDTSGSQASDLRYPTGASSVAVRFDRVMTGGPGPATLWSVRQAAQRARFSHNAPVVAVAISGDGRSFATGSEDGIVRLSTAGPGKAHARIACIGDGESPAPDTDGRRIGTAFAALNGCAAQTQSGAGALPDRLRRAAGAVSSGDERILVSVPHGTGALVNVSNSGRVVVVDVQADRVIADLQTKGSIDGISVSRDGRRVAAVNTDLHVIDTATGRAQSIPIRGRPRAVALSPDGAHIAVGLSEEIRVLDGGTLEQRLSVRQSGNVEVARFSPDGRQFLTSGTDGVVHVWHTDTARELRSWRVGPFVEDAVWSDDGTRIATAAGGVAQIWLTADGSEQFRIAHPDGVAAIAFAGSGTALVTSDGDDIQYHSLDPLVLTSQLCERIHSSLPLEEWRRYFGTVPFEPPCGQRGGDETSPAPDARERQTGASP